MRDIVFPKAPSGYLWVIDEVNPRRVLGVLPADYYGRFAGDRMRFSAWAADYYAAMNPADETPATVRTHDLFYRWALVGRTLKQAAFSTEAPLHVLESLRGFRALNREFAFRHLHIVAELPN